MSTYYNNPDQFETDPCGTAEALRFAHAANADLRIKLAKLNIKLKKYERADLIDLSIAPNTSILIKVKCK